MAEEGNGRISVSRDALRADLAEMKLDIIDRLETSMRTKADKEDVDALIVATKELSQWAVRSQRGEFTDAQRATIQHWVSKAFTNRARESWQGWERKLAVYGLIVGVVGSAGGVGAAVKVFLG